MKKNIFILLFCFSVFAAWAQVQEETFEWDKSIVTIESNRIQYNYSQPWSRQLGSNRKTGIAISGEEILTTADWLQDSTLTRVQKGGRGAWWNAKITWIDYHANLATLSVADPAFWKDLKPALIAEKIPTTGEIQIQRMTDGNLQTWKGVINKVFVQKSQRSFAKTLTLEVTSDMDGGGWSEIATKHGKIIGLFASQDGNRLLAIPSPFIHFVLNAKKSKIYTGLGFFDFKWEYSKNPATLKFLGLEGQPRGIIVTDVPELSAFANVLKSRDVILEIDGSAIDSNGDYRDPEYGYLSFYNLSTRNKLAGDEIRFKIWRDQKMMDVSVRLPKADYQVELVPDSVFDQPPEYVIVGGLVLQPLTDAFLRSWGVKWREASPFRLSYYSYQDPTREQPHLVFLSMVLPDSFNLGYQDYTLLVVDKINGKKVTEARQIMEALKTPQGGFHIIEFAPNKDVQRLVLDAAELEGATKRVLEKYGIPKAFSINSN